MDRLTNHDQFIECGRERFNKRLEERRMAAKAAKENAEQNHARAILTRQDEVKHS